MACCLALVVLIAAARRAWFALPGTGEPQEPGFAPPARRPAPGAVAAPPAEGIRAAPRSVPPPAVAAAARGFVTGTWVYMAALVLLAALGSAELSGAASPWAIRSALVLAVVAVALWAAGRAPAPAGSATGRALIGGGGAFWLWSLVDMHAFPLVEIAAGSLLWDAVVHGVGPMMVTAGILLARRRPAPIAAEPAVVASA